MKRINIRINSALLFFLIYFTTLSFYEFLLRYFTIGYSFKLMPVLFNLCTALLLTAITRLFKANRIIIFSIVMILALAYGSQIYYFYFFDTFFIMVSLFNAGMVAKSFYREIIDLVLHHLEILFYVNIPVILLFIFRKKLKTAPWPTRKSLVMLLCFVLLYSGTLFGISRLDRDNDVYDAYVYHSDIIDSIKNLGLVTTFTVDLTRMTRESLGLTNAIRIPDEVEEEEENEEPSDFLANALDIDFDALIANETDPVRKSMHEYFSKRIPTKQNEKTGLFKDYNLIVITAETFSRWAVREDITPTLYKLVHEGYYFTNFYTPLYTVSTLDGEYMGFTSLIPKSGVWSLKDSSVNDMSFVLGHQLKDLGYTTFAFHNNDYTYYHRELSHPNLGYTYMGVGNGLTATGEWPQSDLDMMKETIPMFINEDQFHIYYMTVSGHSNYYWNANAQSAKNRDLVKDLPYVEYAKGYLASQIELDKAMAYLLDELEKAGKLDKTLIVLSADHYPYNFFEDTLTNLNDGVKVETEFDIYRSPLIIYNPKIKSETITKSVSSLDLLPTIANLMGIKYDSRLMMGTDIFSTAEPLVIFKDHSFITPLGKYNAITKKFIYNDGVTEDEDYVKRMIEVVNTKFYYSQKFLENDYYRIISESLLK